MLEHFILVKTETGSPVCRTKRENSLFQEFLSMFRQDFNLGVYKCCYSLYIFFFTDFKYLSKIFRCINTRHKIGPISHKQGRCNGT